MISVLFFFFFFFQAEDGIRDVAVTGVQTCALPISKNAWQKYQPLLDCQAFFVGQNGRAISYAQAAATFRHLCEDLGLKREPIPRLHDLRHTFAVRCLIDWYRRGEDEVGQKVLSLATYLGHTHIN